jgi:2-oxoisovalerate dehydrogenase E2 component (dihydrolipoyl transacylase)
VPVLRHAETLDVWQKATAIKRLSGQARDGSIALQDLTGSTITLTSLGKLGGIASTPIINKPEVAIIGVNRAEDRVVVRGGKKKIRRMMNLSSSFDHRIIDGYRAAEFIQHIKLKLENPVTLFMA